MPRLALPHAPASEEIIAAGTDGSAVRATVALLQRGDAAGTPPDAVVIQSALALRPSIPDGPLRAEFEAVLARSLMIAGYLPEMTAVLADGPGLATDLLTDALTSLPPERAIETAIRLRPFMRSDAPGIPRAAALMRRFGLDATARQFEALRSDEDLPPPVRLADVADADGAAALSADDRAWLVRDFAALADDAVAAPTDDTVAADPRRTLARLVAARNVADAETDAVVDDFDRARGALDSSRDLSGAMGRLLEGI